MQHEVIERRWRPIPSAMFARNDAVLELSRDALLALYQLFRVCDDLGRFTMSEKALMVSLPWFGRGLPQALRELAKGGLIVCYEVGSRRYGYIRDYLDVVSLSWKPSPVYPDPPDTVSGTVSDTVSHTVPDTVSDTPSHTVPDTVRDRGEERKRRGREEGKNSGGALSDTPRDTRGGVSHAVPDTVSDTPSHTVPDGVSHAVPDTVSDTPSHTVPDGVSHTVPDTVSDTPGDTPAVPTRPKRVQEAVTLWQSALSMVSPATCLADEIVARLADEFGEDAFVAAVEDHITSEPTWMRSKPLAHLRRRCEWAKERAATAPKPLPKSARRPSAGMTHAAHPAPEPPAMTDVDVDRERVMRGSKAKPEWWHGVRSAATSPRMASEWLDPVVVRDVGDWIELWGPDESHGEGLSVCFGDAISRLAPKPVVYR